MKQLTRDTLQMVLDDDGQPGPYATIYVPTHRAATPPNMSEDQIRLKNLVHKAVSMLQQHSLGEQTAITLSEMLRERERDITFWESQTEGLLICAHGTELHLFQLPIDTEEYVAVDDEYHVAAALAVASDQQPYYVLVLAQHKPQLLYGDGFSLQPTTLELPVSVEAGLHLDEPNKKGEQQRSDGGGTGSFNGRGGDRDPREQDRLRFWRLIDQKLNGFADTTLPLIIAGTGSEVAEFRALSHYPQLLDEHLDGNYVASMPAEMLAATTRIITKAIVNRQHEASLEEYKRLSGANPERIADNPAAITEAADAGRIDTLLLGIQRSTTDTVRDNHNPVPTISFADDPEVEATSNHIAQQVFESSGKVVAIEQDAMPGHALVLARLRY